MAATIQLWLIIILAGAVTLAYGQVAAGANREANIWGPFTQDSRDFLTITGDASISGGALQITPDSINNAFLLVNRAGRIVYHLPYTLVNRAGQRASFSTAFSVNIFRPNNATAGEGLAFIVAGNDTVATNSTGQWLGLTNATTDGSPHNRFVAVELDTLQNAAVRDPDGNHIGLDINSVVSNVSVPLTPLGFELAPEIPANYTIWVEYNGSGMSFRAYIDREHRPRPASPVIERTLDLAQIVGDEAYFGFAASTGPTAELNCVLFWNLTVEILHTPGNNLALIVGLGVGIPVVVLLVLAALVGCWWWRWRKRKEREDDRAIEGALRSLPGMPREFKLKELKRATNGFDDKQKLGEGGFGVVYKGWVPGAAAGEPAKEVAVKKFSRENMKGMTDFLAELSIINRLRHRNLVKLEGWCHTNGMLLLVYEYMPNGSLDTHLFADPDADADANSDSDSRPLLTWDRRQSILSNVAAALNYLHHEFNDTVVHRDLKASNILLDADFNARLGDFGLARALDGEKTSYADIETGGVPGTLGYIAPECFHTGRATRESDIFGFGAVVLEVVSGRRPRSSIGGFTFLVDWVWTLYREGRILEAVDPRLAGEYPADEAERLLKLGLACSHPIALERPKTQAIVQIISGSVPPPSVPPIKPSFVWPADRGLADGNSSTFSTDTTPIASSYFGSQFMSRESHENSMQ